MQPSTPYQAIGLHQVTNQGVLATALLALVEHFNANHNHLATRGRLSYKSMAAKWGLVRALSYLSYLLLQPVRSRRDRRTLCDQVAVTAVAIAM